MTTIKPLGPHRTGAPMALSLRSTREIATGAWRTFRPEYQTRPSPCMLDCGAGTDVRAMLTLAAEGDLAGAWRTVREHNPFPGICGRVCYHPCEADCNRRLLDQRVAVHAVERAIADHALHRGLQPEFAVEPQSSRLGVVGAGPAGLSCAYHLARRGYGVTVFDQHREPGGMLRYGIPAYRLPRPVLDAELALLEKMGVTFVGGVRVGVATGVPDLSSYTALFLAIGAQRSRSLHVAGDTLPGVRPGLELLREVNAGIKNALSGPVVVIGGGNTAIDAARVSLRLGAEPTVVYRRGREDMPAHPDEIAQAEAEGVKFVFHSMPRRFIAKRASVHTVECQQMRPGERDRSGRARPEPIPGQTTAIRADHVLTAIGEDVETDAVGEFAVSVNGHVRADRFGRTKRPTVFAGGDASTGAGTVVEAIGSGRRAAEGIDAFVHGRDPVQEGVASRVTHDDVNFFYFRRSPRVEPPIHRAPRIVRNFSEVVGPVRWTDAVAEARRCFSCGRCTTCDNCWVFCPDVAITPDRASGGYRIDSRHCKGCGICVAECPRGAMTLVPEEPR